MFFWRASVEFSVSSSFWFCKMSRAGRSEKGPDSHPPSLRLLTRLRRPRFNSALVHPRNTPVLQAKLSSSLVDHNNTIGEKQLRTLL